MNPPALYHFSEDPNITRFVPHVPRTNPEHRRAVWAIDAEHAPLYWFPRDCPRVTVWPLRGRHGRRSSSASPPPRRLQAIESQWLERMRRRVSTGTSSTRRASFRGKRRTVSGSLNPTSCRLNVSAVGDLLDAHVDGRHRAANHAVTVAVVRPRHRWRLRFQHGQNAQRPAAVRRRSARRRFRGVALGRSRGRRRGLRPLR